ncbi:MAG: 5-(carboxyamino)imidazole ribonucleotide mutase [Planctomycetota bacterium]|nr:5-(carboxyamino)imidazole ribonucleotide mutase [Planctomycetota bacterium]
MADKPRIGFLLGSKSDLPQLDGAEKFLKEIGVPYEVRIISAHRTPARAHEYAVTAKGRGIEVIVGMAGMAAHLAGVLAASAEVPVLGVPASGGPLQGFDALLSTVQMPPGIPVATLGIGKAGATNAAIFACKILACSDEGLHQQLNQFRAAMKAKIEQADEETRGTR